MKKLLKIAVILMALGLLATACSKVKSTSLIGTYKHEGGKAYLVVGGDGSFEFNSNGEADFSAFNGFSGYLIPWDLTSEKESYSYKITDTTTNITFELKFEQSGENIRCEVKVTIPQVGIENITFVK